MRKSLLLTIAILVLLGVALWFWMFRKAGRYELGQGIPADAVFVVRHLLLTASTRVYAVIAFGHR